MCIEHPWCAAFLDLGEGIKYDACLRSSSQDLEIRMSTQTVSPTHAPFLMPQNFELSPLNMKKWLTATTQQAALSYSREAQLVFEEERSH